jgi:hypothetical protein
MKKIISYITILLAVMGCSTGPAYTVSMHPDGTLSLTLTRPKPEPLAPIKPEK